MVAQSGDYMEYSLFVFLLVLALYLKNMSEVIILLFTIETCIWCYKKNVDVFLCLALDFFLSAIVDTMGINRKSAITEPKL